MSSCIDQKYEKMIHAFEMDMLKEEDRREFEQHLLKCQSCFSQVQEFIKAARLLRHDPGFKKDAINDVESKIVSKKKWFNITRILAAAALIVVIALPVYWFLIPADRVQEIMLLPDRSSDNNTLSIQDGGIARISFAVDNFNKGTTYNLVIISLSGDTIFSEPDFTDFNEKGLGSISLPVSDFTVDHYTLIVSPNIVSDSMDEVQYMFRVK